VHGQGQHAEHAVGAVDERQPLLLGEPYRREASVRQGLPGRTERTGGVDDLALAHQRERGVREGREVTGASERTVLADHRGDAGVQHRRVRADGVDADARPTGHEGG
jgi:hypothetical protein